MADWSSLLGLPLQQALDTARTWGAEPTVLVTCAPRRKDLTKQVKKGAEDAKVAVRAIRRDAIEQVKKLKKDSLITEDDQRKAEEDAQKLTDKAIKEIDTVAAAKEKEIMEV